MVFANAGKVFEAFAQFCNGLEAAASQTITKPCKTLHIYWNLQKPYKASKKHKKPQEPLRLRKPSRMFLERLLGLLQGFVMVWELQPSKP